MSVVTISFINVKNSQCMFCDPFIFEIRFECCKELDDDLEWKLVYVGSAENEQYDQELEDVFVGPVNVGTNQFVFQTPGPDPSKVPVKDMLGVTVVLLSALFHGKEFIRIGYYVNNHYRDEELNQNPPPVSETSPIDARLVERTIRDDKPRITLFPIDWDHPEAPLEPPVQEGDGADAGAAVGAEDDLDEDEDDGGASSEDGAVVEELSDEDDCSSGDDDDNSGLSDGGSAAPRDSVGGPSDPTAMN